MTNFGKAPYYEKYENEKLYDLYLFGIKSFVINYGMSAKVIIERELSSRERIIKYDKNQIEKIEKSIKDDEEVVKSLKEALAECGKYTFCKKE